MSDVGLDWVGMQGIALPLELAGKPLMAKVDAGINLRAEAAGERGIHMSRLYLALDELTQGELTPQRIGRTLQAFLASQPEHSDRASLSISGELLLSRPALLSPQRGWKAYPLRINAEVLAAAQRWADDELRSLNAQIEYVLRDALRKAGRLPKPTPSSEDKE